MATHKMHANEVEISSNLIRKLLLNQFPHWKDLSLEVMQPQGTDNAMYKLGDDKVLRLPRTKQSSLNIEKELNWLPKLGPQLPIPIPMIIGKGMPQADYPFPWLVCEWLDGKNPDKEEMLDLYQGAVDLGSFVNAMGKIKPMNAPKCRRGQPLSTRDEEVKQSIPLLGDGYDTNLLTEVWESVLEIPKWSKALTWIHGDLHAGNLLVKKGLVIGVVDFGLAGIGDPACDMMVAWTLLSQETRDVFRSIVQPDNDTWNRGRGWALFLGIVAYPYYRSTNPQFARIAKRALDEVIADSK